LKKVHDQDNQDGAAPPAEILQETTEEVDLNVSTYVILNIP